MAQLQDKQAQTIDRLEKYKKYQAVITLSGIEMFAHNIMLREKFMEVGFTNVLIEGTGPTRTATGIWSRESQPITAMPPQISEIKEL